MSAVPPSPPVPGTLRVRLFVDFWNLQLTLNERQSRIVGCEDARFKIDWRQLPAILVREAASFFSAPYAYEGTIVFTSYNPRTEEGKKYRSWVTGWLDRQMGIQVKCSERRPKRHPKCPKCHQDVEKCPDPQCAADLAGTSEKGVDTGIATDMIRLAWEDAYDIAVVASSDADLVPAVEFLDQRGFKVIQAGFPPLGSHLSRACWATIDVWRLREQFRRG